VASLSARVAGRGGQFASGVSLVEVYATVTDAKGEPVANLTASDFVVEEDGVPQEVRAFAQGEFPLSLAIGLDRSFSVAPARLSGIAGALQGFLRSLRSQDEAMLLGIGSETALLAPLSRDREPALGALSRLDPWGTTPLYDAMVSAVDAIQPARGRRALVLVSDGVDRYSDASPATLVDTVRRRDVLVYPVTLSRRPPAVFAEVAAVSGGRSFQVRDPRELPAAFETIARELRAQYLLGYDPPADGSRRPGWRSIRVRVTQPGVVVRARDGYLQS
jgi:Ca-activated chloride channel family protein